MQLIVLGSSSSGNGYILRSDTGETLLLEAGVPLATVKKTLDYNIKGIVGCLITHEHGDHGGYAQEYAKACIRLVMSTGTADAVGVAYYHVASRDIHTPNRLGGFRVLAFSTQHDAADPLGYLIHHKECGNVLFVTDTACVRQTFRGLNNIMIECNYSPDLMYASYERGIVSRAQMDRTMRSHLSYAGCVETLRRNNLTAVNNIVLLHLSDNNSNAAEFADGIRGVTGKDTICAEAGLVIDFNKTPF